MKRLRPSLVRRLALGFALASVSVAIIVLALLRPMLSEAEEDNAGVLVAIHLLADDLESREGGGLALKPQARTLDIARRSPELWFVVRDEDGKDAFTFGRPPAAMSPLLRSPSIKIKEAHLALGSDRATDVSVLPVEGPNGTLTIFGGGVRAGATSASDWAVGFLRDPAFYAAMVIVSLIAMAGAPFAIPIVLRSIRPVAKAAARLDPTNLAGRLSEDRVVKEMLPLVRAFNAALDRLSDAFEQRRRFIADVAHELRTPLAVLNVQIETIPDGPQRADLQRTLFRVSQMVGQMLDAERLTLAGRRREPVDLVDLARTVTADVAPLAMANGYEVAFRAAQPKVAIEGDWNAITHAVSNLLGNAIAHGGATGTIQVSVTDDAAIEVSDEGPGVPPEARERIFEPFHRERWDRDGCGLGLHLVQEIMHSHGGKAAVVGSGPGATFRLSFDGRGETELAGKHGRIGYPGGA